MSVTLQIQYTTTNNIPLWGKHVSLIRLELNTTNLTSIKIKIQSLPNLSIVQKETMYTQFLPFFRHELPHLLFWAKARNKNMVYRWTGVPYDDSVDVSV